LSGFVQITIKIFSKTFPKPNYQLSKTKAVKKYISSAKHKFREQGEIRLYFGISQKNPKLFHSHFEKAPFSKTSQGLKKGIINFHNFPKPVPWFVYNGI